MRSFALSALIGAATLAAASGVGLAADLAEAPVYKAPEVEIIGGGWYLRGDIGFSNQQVGSLDSIEYQENNSFVVLDKSFDAAPFFVLGAGYQFNDWFRVDVTGEYRGKSSFSGLDTYTFDEYQGINDYSANKSEWTFLANAYIDLGTWYSITPFIGAGIGASRNTISDFTDFDPNNGVFAYANSDSKWNFAWALYAGLGYAVTPNFTIEFAYRYLNLGDGQTGDVMYPDGTSTRYNPLYFDDIVSHDLKVGFRWKLGSATTVQKY